MLARYLKAIVLVVTLLFCADRSAAAEPVKLRVALFPYVPDAKGI